MDYRDEFIKYIHVVKIEDENTWVAYIWTKKPYEEWEDNPDEEVELPECFDVMAAKDETILLSRVKREHSAFVIGYTDGAVEFVPY